MKIWKYIKDIIAPQKCYGCKREGHFFCSECFKDLPRYEPFCYICKWYSEGFSIHKSCQPASSLSKVIVYGRYHKTILQKLIQDGKYYGKKEVFQDLGRELGNFFSLHHTLTDTQEYLVLATPMCFFRRWKRGYNQSDILAAQIAEQLGVSCNTKIIIKKRYTKQQSHLWRLERLQNLRGAFRLDKRYIGQIKNKKIILVDDVISTWSTLAEIASIFKIYGAKEVIGLVIASD
jgi:ComF family protein